MLVPHHAAKLDNLPALLEQSQQRLQAARQALEADKQNTRESIYSASLAIAGCLALLKPDAQELFYALDTAAMAMTDILRLAKQPAGAVKLFVYVSNNETRLPTTGPTTLTNARNWIEAFCLAVVARRDMQMETLLDYPEEILEQSSTASPQYALLSVKALRSFALRQPMQSRRGQLALQAVEQTAAESNQDALRLRRSEVHLLAALLARDSAGFNAALLRHLEIHKDYWGAAGRRENPRGWLSVFGLGLATIFFKAGEQVKVESPYLPMSAITAKFSG